jgi:hypothetical protein
MTPNTADKDLEAKILAKADEILRIYESEGEAASYELWLTLDSLTALKRNILREEFFDLLTQLEFFMEGHPESDLGDLRHALYVAQATVK